MSYYWDVVKDMDESQKLELVTMLIESVKPIQTTTLFDMPNEEEFSDMDKELYTPEEAYELTMKAPFGCESVIAIGKSPFTDSMP